jgi:hypothetical protein
MIQILMITLAVCGAIMAAAVVSFLARMAWIAHGEADVNGDPERDATPSPEFELVCYRCGRHLDGVHATRSGGRPFQVHDVCPACQARHSAEIATLKSAYQRH